MVFHVGLAPWKGVLVGISIRTIGFADKDEPRRNALAENLREFGYNEAQIKCFSKNKP